MLKISKPKTIDEVIAKFVTKKLPKISGETDYTSLNEMIQALYYNVADFPRTLYGRKHGHVGLIMKDTLYAALDKGTTWVYPYSTSSIPTIYTNETVTRHQEDNETYGEVLRIF